MLVMRTGRGNDTVDLDEYDSKLTLRDQGGQDTLDFQDFNGGIRLSLMSRSYQYMARNTWLSLSGTWESVFATPFNDTVYGNHASNSLYGLAGRDRLYGLFGDDILSGGEDADWLFGSWGDDVMIGGNGRDCMFGGFGDDLMIGNQVDYAEREEAMRQVFAEWTGPGTLDERIVNLRDGGGRNGMTRLQRELTILDDGERNLLIGGYGQDADDDDFWGAES
jgi:Ca2+-binding RTX toxin-like protein